MSSGQAVSNPWAAEREGYSALAFELTESIRWRKTEEGYAEVYRPHLDAWKKHRPYYVPVFEGLEAGCSLPEIHERIAEAYPDLSERKIRKVVMKATSRLRRWGYMEVELPPAPDVFDGRYRRVEELGRGGMGIVWLCQDLESPDERMVAVKHAWNWKGSYEKRERSLKEEGEVMANLDHDAIVELYDTFEQGDRFHLVREYVPGTRMSKLAREEPIPERDRIRFLRAMAATQKHLLDRGYLLLDFKPGSFFVTPDRETVKLGDLGFCQGLEDGQREVEGTLATRLYNPPEALQNRVVDESTFVYVMGASACQLVTERTPKATTKTEKLERRLPRVLDVMEERGAEAWETFFVERCCHPDPGKRPASLAEVLEILEVAEGA